MQSRIANRCFSFAHLSFTRRPYRLNSGHAHILTLHSSTGPNQLQRSYGRYGRPVITHLRYFSSTARAEILLDYKVAGFGRTTLQFTGNSVVELKAAIIANSELGLKPDRLKLYVVNSQKKEEDLETLEEQLEEGAFLNLSNLPLDYRIARNNPMIVRIIPSFTISSTSSTSISPAAFTTERGSDFYKNPPKREKFNKFPVHSISDFKTLVQEGYYFADRTSYIKQIEEDNNVLMFLRPKRFGKSLFLSTLKHFYDINGANYFKELFGPFDIFCHAPEMKHSKFLIFELNFSVVKRSSDIAVTNRELAKHVIQSIECFCEQYSNVLGISSEILKQSVIDPNSCTISLGNLFRRVGLAKHQVYVLIDEYDAITNEFLDSHDVLHYNQLRDEHSELKAIFATIKNHCSKGVGRVFITGVTPLSMADVTSGFNIGSDISLIPRYSQMMGLTENDIQECLQYICQEKDIHEDNRQNFIDSHLEQIRQNYNGYRFAATDGDTVYCTNLCLTYLHKLLVGDPLVLVDANHELNIAMLHFISSHSSSSELLADLLVKGETEIDSIHTNFRLADFAETEIDFLKSFLFYIGGLTFSDKEGLLCIPNLVVRKTIIDRVNQIWNIETKSDRFNLASNELLTEGSIDLLCKYLEERMRLIQRGNLGDHNELVTKAMFLSSLSAIPGLRVATEVPVPKINGTRQKGTGKLGYIDLLTIEKKPATGGRPLRMLFEFKNKGIPYLDLKGRQEIGNTWEDMERGAKMVEEMDHKELMQMTTGNKEKYDRKKTMGEILDAGEVQVSNYVRGLKEEDQIDYTTIAFVVLTVGSRRVLWKKVDTISVKQ